jgi:fluoroacetyl-CoA thioesterase
MEGALMSKLSPGLWAEFEHVVTDVDTASHWGSGGLPVFSTPSLVGLMESAAVIALRGQLDNDQTTVGGHIDVHHLAATAVGSTVRARAELVAIQGRKLVFRIQAWDEVELIGEADHERILINEEKFMEKVGKKNRRPIL